MQQAQALEEARQKHAAAQEACASVEQEIEVDEDEDDECMHDADQDKGRDPYQEWYNPSAHFSHSAEIQEVRTVVSQISATLALLVKALAPGILEAGTQFQSQRSQTPQWGVIVEETPCFRGPTERFALETPPKLRADSEEEKGAGERARKQSSGKFRERSCECIATFGVHRSGTNRISEKICCAVELTACVPGEGW